MQPPTRTDAQPLQRRSPSQRRSGDRGQSTVEFALVLPILAIIALGVVQVGVAIRNELAVDLAAREGARAGAVSASPTQAARSAAVEAVELPITVSSHVTETRIAVTVTYVDPTDVAIIGRFLGAVTHQSTVTMAFEP